MFFKKVGFTGGLVVKNLSASAGDTGSIPDLGISASEQLSPCATAVELALYRAQEPQLLSTRAATTEGLAPLEPVLHNKRSHLNEKPTHHN